MVENERRSYQRSRISGEALVNSGGVWVEAQISDMSSSGIQLTCDEKFDLGAKIGIKLVLYGLASEFEIKTEGVVRHKLFTKYSHLYGMEFEGLSHDTKIRIDEMLMQMRPRHMPYEQ